SARGRGPQETSPGLRPGLACSGFPQFVDVVVDSDSVGEALRLVGEAQLLWTACAGVLKEHVSETVWVSSFAETTAIAADSDHIVLAVPSLWVKERIESRYVDMIRAALADVGAPGLDIDIEISPTVPIDTSCNPGAEDQVPLPDIEEEVVVVTHAAPVPTTQTKVDPDRAAATLNPR